MIEKVVLSDKSNRLLTTLIWLAIGIHVVFTLRILSPVEILNNEPIYSGDYPLHLYRVHRYLDSGQANGYDPYLIAGYQFTKGYDIGARPMQLLCKVFSFVRPELVFKLHVFLGLVLVPFVLYLACVDFGFSRRSTALLLILGLLFTWKPVYNYVLVTHGVINYFFASYLSLLLVSSFYRYSIDGQRPKKMTILILSAIAVFLHILSILIIALPLLIIFLVKAKGYDKKAYLFFALVIFCTGLANYPVIMSAGDDVAGFLGIAEAESKELQLKSYDMSHDDFEEPVHLTDTNLADSISKAQRGLIFLIIPGFGIFLLWRKGQKTLAMTLSSWMVFLFYLSFFGSYSNFFVMAQPVRFKLNLMFVSLFPMALGANQLVTWMESKLISKPQESVFVPVLFGILLLPICYKVFPLISPNDINAKLPEEGVSIVEWIKENTKSTGGRILLESSEAKENENKVYFGGHFPAILPYLTKREFVGSTVFVRSFAKFMDQVLFDRFVNKFDEEEIRQLFQFYNIAHIICWSDMAIEKFRTMPDLIRYETSFGRFHIFTVNSNTTFFLKGSGEITANYNQIQVHNAVADENEIVLKYHWDPHFVISPSGVIEEEPIAKDAIGFIKIVDPPEEFTVSFKQ